MHILFVGLNMHTHTYFILWRCVQNNYGTKHILSTRTYAKTKIFNGK